MESSKSQVVTHLEGGGIGIDINLMVVGRPCVFNLGNRSHAAVKDESGVVFLWRLPAVEHDPAVRLPLPPSAPPGMTWQSWRSDYRCPRCGYPDTNDGEHFKGVYTPGKPCDLCGYEAKGATGYTQMPGHYHRCGTELVIRHDKQLGCRRFWCPTCGDWAAKPPEGGS